MPCCSVSALLTTSVGSISVSGMPLEKFAIAACIAFASALQVDQQLWNSERRRTTSRDCAGVSRSILLRAAA